MNSGFPELFDEIRRAVKPSKPFVVAKQTLSYGDLFERTAKLGTLFADRGLGREDRVVIASADDHSVITLFLALVGNGMTAVILDPEASGPELRALIKAADPALLFMDPSVAQRADPDHGNWRDRLIEIGLGKARRKSLFGRRKAGSEDQPAAFPALLDSLAPAQNLAAEIPDTTVAYILFTSGTTSRPKGVEITHRNLLSQMATFRRHYGYDEDTRLLNILPLHHTDGLTQGPVVAFTCGATVHRPMRFRIDLLPDLLDGIYVNRVTHFVTVPSVLSLMANLAGEYTDCFDTEEFRFVISTAAYLDPKLWRDFEAKFGTMVVNVYGLTETVCEALYCGPDEATRKPGTVGKPVDGEARIVGDDGRDAAPGQVGELLLRGDHIMKGYFRMPEETAEVLRGGWFHTGDLAQVDDEGFYRIVGRKKDVIISGGINIYPEDVTNVLRGLPGVMDAVTLGQADPSWGERVVACVVPVPGSDLSREEIAKDFLEQASSEKLPREIHIVSDLPRGPAGKVILSEVRAMLSREADSQPAGATGGAVQSRLLERAAEAFQMPVDALSLDSAPDNTRGWNSLAHVELLMAIEKEFDFRMAPQDVMNIKSIADALKVVEAKLAAG